MISPLPEALVETEILLHGIQFHECSLDTLPSSRSRVDSKYVRSE
jgi:hypothetical protein